MLMNKRLKIFFLILLCSSSAAWSQTNSDREQNIQQQIDQLMKAREEMLKSLLNDNGFDDFDKSFEDLIKKFDRSAMVPGESSIGAVVGEYDWRETPTQKIFVLKVKQIKDKPLDIKIEKGQILLKGDVESASVDPSVKSKKVTRVHFERSFSIPEGVDQSTPEFENSKGEVLIKFKKLAAKKLPAKMITPKADPLTPLEPDPSDVVI